MNNSIATGCMVTVCQRMYGSKKFLRCSELTLERTSPSSLFSVGDNPNIVYVVTNVVVMEQGGIVNIVSNVSALAGNLEVSFASMTMRPPTAASSELLSIIRCMWQCV